jgi:CheY-like chemotaxis protein
MGVIQGIAECPPYLYGTNARPDKLKCVESNAACNRSEGRPTIAPGDSMHLKKTAFGSISRPRKDRLTGLLMTYAIDVLLIDPSSVDAKKTSAAIKRKAPQTSIVHVSSGDQAARLMFEQGLLTQSPQQPRLIVVDLAAAGDPAKTALRRLSRQARNVPIVVFSARRNAKDILDAHLLGADMNVLKSPDDAEYASAVERIVTLWQAGRLLWRVLEAS